MTAPVGTDWAVDRVVTVTDGDTLRLIRRRTLTIDSDLACDVYDANPRGVPVRLVTVDTPERGQAGYADATRDVTAWLELHAGRVRVETWPGGGFDRLLGDLYVAGDRSDTLTQWMLRDRGWLPYVRGE